jgi:hypothetical protein
MATKVKGILKGLRYISQIFGKTSFPDLTIRISSTKTDTAWRGQSRQLKNLIVSIHQMLWRTTPYQL